MGNHRFRLSDMMPNAWFYKLKDMNRGVSRSHGSQHSLRRSHPSRTAAAPASSTPPTSHQSFIPNRASYYFPRGSETEKFPISPKTPDNHSPINPKPRTRRSSRRKPANPPTKLMTSSVSAGCSCRVWKPDSHHQTEIFTNDEDDNPCINSWSYDCDCGNATSSPQVPQKPKDFDLISELELPPIITKPEPNKMAEKTEREQSRGSARRSPHRLRMRGSSPRIRSKKTNPASKRSTAAMSESFAVVKRSSDPHRDFRDSMLEMIVENNILASKDLEELLACYLTLNSSEYHDVIVKVFEQIWFDLTDIINCK